MNTTVELDRYKVENITECTNGVYRGILYALKTDEHGRESWICQGGISKRQSQSWQNAIELTEENA